MEKKIYLVRHCKAEGQSTESTLTQNGLRQSECLAHYFSTVKVDQIISSPYLRAIQTIEPLSKKLDLQIKLDKRLSERRLSSKNLPGWYETLKATFDDMNLKLEGGESSREAAIRIVGIVEEVLRGDDENTILVTHGNILSLLINHYNPDFGFEEWQSLSNPDVFLLRYSNNKYLIEHLWKDKGDESKKL